MADPLFTERLLETYNTHHRAVYARCRRMLADHASAEDATHEVLLRVAGKLMGLAASDALRWIQRAATNYCLNEIRDASRRPELRDLNELEIHDGGGEAALADRDLAERIIARVPERLRAAAWLYYVDGMTHDEVGKTLGLSRRTVITYITAFHEKARKGLPAER